MKDYLNEINSLFPIRRRVEEKAKFLEYVKGELGDERVHLERLEDKHNNIIIGDVESAKVIFTAHYDTPAASLVPNLMIPANKLIGTLYHFLYPLAMALLSLFVALTVAELLGLDSGFSATLYLVLYFGLFFCTTRMLPNKNNKNDNTSGVATVMSLANEICDGRAAFILFDNEEKGLLGSKAFNKAHTSLLSDKMIINFDCVGNGDRMLFIIKEGAALTKEYELLKESVTSDADFTVHHIPAKKAISNSDYKSFPRGVGVMACSRGKIIKFRTGRIHTKRDTVADSKNIYFLTDAMVRFVEKL